MTWNLPFPPKLPQTIPVARGKLSIGVVVGGWRQAESVFGLGLGGRDQMKPGTPDRQAEP